MHVDWSTFLFNSILYSWTHKNIVKLNEKSTEWINVCNHIRSWSKPIFFHDKPAWEYIAYKRVYSSSLTRYEWAIPFVKLRPHTKYKHKAYLFQSIRCWELEILVRNILYFDWIVNLQIISLARRNDHFSTKSVQKKLEKAKIIVT